MAGPSPRGWGILTAKLFQMLDGRTIPTRVGNTSGCPLRRSMSADHPHAGGEYSNPAAAICRFTGPSPRGWGILHTLRDALGYHRTIPTRVGNTARSSGVLASRTDHPHAGGEYASTPSASCAVIGPSPRGWGIRSETRRRQAQVRTIPTRVGNTGTGPVRRMWPLDHPHSGGEYHCSRSSAHCSGGPSPRGWGILSVGFPNHRWMRTIPTRVGNTRHSASLGHRSSDHPHAGGEYPGLAGTYGGNWYAFWRFRRAGFGVRPTPRLRAKGRTSRRPAGACRRGFGS